MVTLASSGMLGLFAALIGVASLLASALVTDAWTRDTPPAE